VEVLPGLLDANVVVVLFWLTVCVSAEDVLELKLPSPLYAPVMLWFATESAEVVYVALPDASTLTVLRVVAPSLKVTVPVGVPAPGLVTVTVAVKVTD
jgi:hypothetical protein